MKLQEINNVIESLEKLGEIELLTHYYKRRKRLLNLLAYHYKSTISSTIFNEGIGALSTEELEVAQYLYDTKELSF